MKELIKSLIIALTAAHHSAAFSQSEIINEAGDNVTILRTFPTGVSIAFRGQLSWNSVIIDPQNCIQIGSNDDIFAQESITLDCTSALQTALAQQMPQLAAPVAGQFLVPATSDLVHNDESSNRTLVVKSYSCALQEIQTASKEDAFSNSTGIGFFFADTTSTVQKNDLAFMSRSFSRSGEKLIIHRFVAPAFCTAGSRSASLRATYPFKPFMEFVNGEGATFRSWDNNANYVISESSVRAFDRTPQILQ